MTPAAIRAAEGPALDAFVAERVCGAQIMLIRPHPDSETTFNLYIGGDQESLPPISTDNAACWRWVVPAVRVRGWTTIIPTANISGEWQCVLATFTHNVHATAPTPALAIVRAAALTVAEGGE